MAPCKNFLFCIILVSLLLLSTMVMIPFIPYLSDLMRPVEGVGMRITWLAFRVQKTGQRSTVYEFHQQQGASLVPRCAVQLNYVDMAGLCQLVDLSFNLFILTSLANSLQRDLTISPDRPVYAAIESGAYKLQWNCTF